MLNLNTITFKNLLSYGNRESTFELSRDGEHNTIGIIGLNGNGKTAIFDAIYFALFNSPYRKINKTDLVNRVNKKGLYVKLDLTANGNEYTIERGISPTFIKISVNGEEEDLDAHSSDIQKYIETQIIGINEKVFRMVFMVGLGTFKSFFTYGIADRRNIFEFIAGVNILSIMLKKVTTFNSKLKTSFSKVGSKLAELERLGDVYEEKLADIKKLNKGVSNKAEIKELEAEIKKLDKELKKVDIDKTYAKIKDNEKELKKLKKDQREADGLLRDTKRTLNEDNDLYSFYEDTDVCDRCHQDITPKFKKGILDNLTTKIEANDKEVTTLNGKSKALESAMEKLDDLICELDSETVVYETKEDKVTTLTARVKRYKDADNNSKEDKKDVIAQTKKDIAETIKDIGVYTKKLATIEGKLAINKIFILTLGDKGVKKHIYTVLLRKINRYVNTYISGFNFNGKLEIMGDLSERFYYKSEDKIKYASFSNGEKLIIDFSFIFGIMKFTEEFYGFRSNFLFFDEILDTSLDTNNKTFLLENLKMIEKNIIIISHDYDLSTSFDVTYYVNKDDGFSSVKEMV